MGWAATPQVQQSFVVAGFPEYHVSKPIAWRWMATVFWNAPCPDGGSAITGYKIEQCDEAGILCSVVNANTGSAVTFVHGVGF